MTIQELAQKQPFNQTDPLLEFRKAVNVQAVRHCQRRVGSKAVDIIEVARPNESDAIKQYRSDNERQITREGVDKFISKTSRIITKGLRFNSIEGKLLEYLSERPFYDTGNRYDFQEYLHGVLFPLSIENPNLLAVAFPYNPLRPTIAPNNSIEEGGLTDKEKLGIKIKLIEPLYVDNEVFAFVGGKRRVSSGGTGTTEQVFYFAADKDNWYTLEPSYESIPGKGKLLIYTPVVWYAWDLGTSPVNMLPGSVATTMKGKYRESFLMPYFNLADEAINAFSDNQAIRVRFAHPVVGIEEVACYNPSCNHGKIMVKGEKPKTCNTCHGTGTVASPGPFGTLVKRKSGLTKEGNTAGPAMEFYNPEVAIMSESWKTWKELMVMAKQAVGLDLLEGSGTESGKAKDLRMEDLQDRLMAIAMSLGTCGSQLLQQIEALLTPVLSDRKIPGYVVPSSFKLYEASELKENAEEAIFEDRYESRMDYYNHKYRGRPELVRMYELALAYSPSILLTEEELTKRIASGALSKDDVSRRDNATLALQRLSSEGKIDLLDISEEAAMIAIEAYLVARKLVTPLDDADLEENREKSPLLETVGGTTAIVLISQAVADGKMTEKAAEALLVEIFGFTSEKAAQLIDIPANGATQGEAAPAEQGDG
ncbi:MAG: hypothetical protein AAGA31_05700 [Bacteroidota bacterium]